ncbi:hypothetical protein E1A91_A03G050800v1 [Gossypium mustelinum]|uniref:Uncharacterized protein n=1 Tax=Gossypium mustelinum TaxID=34275 RepID=A0A5D2ZTC6_GOSMU|nr:hypothetical protein E1A91_A03G050800v1 [Gossypium mustelinum]TYJ41892.1 hypothetical protein E1A91_A03G050800v1 [Gossypium mustelinum]
MPICYFLYIAEILRLGSSFGTSHHCENSGFMSTASPSVVLGIVVGNPLLHFRRHPFATSPSASPFCQPICLASIHIDLGKALGPTLW